jgi:ribose transport system permease protein
MAGYNDSTWSDRPAEQTSDAYDVVEEVLTGALERGSEIRGPGPAGWTAFLERLLTNRDFAIMLVTSFIFLFFGLASPRFLELNNLMNVVRQVSLIGIVAVGMTYVFIAGELDLSVGSNYGLLVTALAHLIVREALDAWSAVLIIIGLGLGVGLINGLLVTMAGLPSFIVTMGSMVALRGATNLVSGGYPISARDTDSIFYRARYGFNLL